MTDKGIEKLYKNVSDEIHRREKIRSKKFGDIPKGKITKIRTHIDKVFSGVDSEINIKVPVHIELDVDALLDTDKKYVLPNFEYKYDLHEFCRDRVENSDKANKLYNKLYNDFMKIVKEIENLAENCGMDYEEMHDFILYDEYYQYQ
jgi:hypothetical protein